MHLDPDHSQPARRGPALGRRHFLLAAAVTGGAAAGSMALPAIADPGQIKVDENEAFVAASRRHGVPAAVLAALSHAQTRWQDHDGRPSAALGYGPMHLVDGAAVAIARARIGKPAQDEGQIGIDTLGRASELTGTSKQQLRTDPVANIDGAAAVLAATQKSAGRPVGADTDPAVWFASVADAAGLTTPTAQLEMADTVVKTLTTGGSLTLADGTRFTLPKRSIGSYSTQRKALQKRCDRGHHHHDDGPIDAPRGLDVEWIPAPYEQYGEGAGDYGNHDLAFRPRNPSIDYIVIHDTEGYWEGVLKLVQDPTYVSWQYSLRSADGHIAQHLEPKDVGWHAGNWWVNSHSIGLEHEGFAAQGAPWFSEAMYRTSARLVRHLCQKYRIPMDRAHIIGHDQVPGTTTPTIPGMHWDPGPFWDWEHYFDLLGAPLSRGTSRGRLRTGDRVRVLPGFAGNKQPVSGCEVAGDDCSDKDTNFVTLRVAPADDAALVNDPGLHQKGQPASTYVSDTSARAAAGTDLVIAEIKGDWIAVWWVGVKAWLKNPATRPVVRKVGSGGWKVTPKRGKETIEVFGRCYPEPEAYSDPEDVQTISPLLYTIPAGQEYALGDADPQTDYYKAQTFSLDTENDHVDIKGKLRYVQIHHGHRIAFVKRDDVDLKRC